MLLCVLFCFVELYSFLFVLLFVLVVFVCCFSCCFCFRSFCVCCACLLLFAVFFVFAAAAAAAAREKTNNESLKQPINQVCKQNVIKQTNKKTERKKQTQNTYLYAQCQELPMPGTARA